MIEHFFTVLAACGGLPPSTTTWSSPPSAQCYLVKEQAEEDQQN